MRHEAIVLVGVPGCGKSTYAEMFKKFYGYEIVERDMIRLQMMKERGLQAITDTRVDYSKWNWEWPNEEIVTDKHRALIKDFSNQLKSIVISDVNLSYRYNLIPFLRKHGYKVKVQYLYTPLQVCLQRNEKRIYPIWDGVIMGHHDYLIEQLQKEILYDKEPTIVICHSCEETKHLADIIPSEYFVIRYRYNDIVWDVYRKHKDVVDVIIKYSEKNVK
jgi:predicted kinase